MNLEEITKNVQKLDEVDCITEQAKETANVCHHLLKILLR